MHCLGPDLMTELSSGGVLGVCDVQTPSQSLVQGVCWECVMSRPQARAGLLGLFNVLCVV